MVAPAIVAVLPSLIDWLGKVIAKAVPDPDKAADIMIEVRRMEHDGELAELTSYTEVAKAQTEINSIEAASSDRFKSYWRPAAGWICVAGLGYQFLVRPLLILLLVLVGVQIDYGIFELDIASLSTLLFGMLGLGIYRTVEKRNGVA